MENFYGKLAEILEVDELKPDDVLQDFEDWDSLTVLSVLAMLDANYGVNLTAGDLRQIKTAAELAAAVESATRR
ncbi:MAG: acyl carrier protein [Verrucomicrobia bacterium]|nr:acyl carrier protein [Verrucomicrobiota bacterium]